MLESKSKLSPLTPSFGQRTGDFTDDYWGLSNQTSATPTSVTPPKEEERAGNGNDNGFKLVKSKKEALMRSGLNLQSPARRRSHKKTKSSRKAALKRAMLDSQQTKNSTQKKIIVQMKKKKMVKGKSASSLLEAIDFELKFAALREKVEGLACVASEKYCRFREGKLQARYMGEVTRHVEKAKVGCNKANSR